METLWKSRLVNDFNAPVDYTDKINDISMERKNVRLSRFKKIEVKGHV